MRIALIMARSYHEAGAPATIRFRSTGDDDKRKNRDDSRARSGDHRCCINTVRPFDFAQGQGK
jgi:hypothetical protein